MTVRPTIKLGKVASLVMGQAPAAADCNKSGVGTPFVKVGEFGLERPVIREWTTDPKKFARSTDVLICVVGATCGKINLGIDCAIGRSVAAIRPHPDKLDQRYLWYFMQGKVEEMRGGSQGAAQTVINREMINDVQILLPSLDEQRRIVAVLEEAFAAIATVTANAEKNLANLEEALAAVILYEFEDRACEWSLKPFEACIEKVKSPAKIQRRDFKTQGAFPIVSQEADFINGFWDDANDVLEVKSPLVVFGDHTQVLKYIDFDFVLGADGVKLLLPKPFLDARFLFYFLKANPVGSKGYARHYRYLKSLEVPVPPIDEQKRIAARLDAIVDAMHELKLSMLAKSALHGELKQSLLYRAFSGEITATTSELITA